MTQHHIDSNAPHVTSYAASVAEYDAYEYIEGSPTLSALRNTLESVDQVDRLGVLLSFVAEHGIDWSVSYLQLEGDWSEYPIVTFLTDGEPDAVMTLCLTDESLDDSVCTLAQAMGY